MAILESKLIASLVDRVTGPARGIVGTLGRLRAAGNGFMQTQRMAAAPMLGFSRSLIAYGGAYLGVTAGMRGTVGAAMNFESAFADVKKVLEASDEQFSNIRRDIIAMSKEMPIAASGIAEIYAAAGQANIAIPELRRFSDMVAKVSTAWEVPVGETGQALAEIKNQLNLSVSDLGLFADAVNHIGNNSAASAPRLLEYVKRVAATGEMFGFSADQTLAFGGAMIAAGGQSEVAATSFRNMGRALTIGTRATKTHQTAFRRLGLDSIKVAKDMQKNALGTTLDVLDRIQALPEWERISIASALFGDEARALMPLIANSTELRRQLGMVADSASYAGSAFEEYRRRADTAANTLDRLKNNFAAMGIGIGESFLPSINEAMKGMLDLFETMGERATPLKQFETAFKGFMHGLGYDGSIREMVNDLGDLLLGPADGSAGADKLGAIFVRFREWGASVRELNDAISGSPIAGFLSELGGYGMQLAAASIGFALLAGTVRSLAGALYFLSGAKAAVSILRGLGRIGGVLMPAGKAGASGKGSTQVTPPAGTGSGGWMKALGLTTLMATWSSLVQALGDTPGEDFAKQVENQRKFREDLQGLLGLGGPKESTGRAHLSTRDDGGRSRALDEYLGNPGVTPPPSFNWRRFLFGDAAEPGFNFRDHMKIDAGVDGPQDVSLVGDPAVRVTNPPPRPNITVTINMGGVHGVTDPTAIAGQVSAALESRIRDSMAGLYADSGHSVA